MVEWGNAGKTNVSGLIEAAMDDDPYAILDFLGGNEEEYETLDRILTLSQPESIRTAIHYQEDQYR